MASRIQNITALYVAAFGKKVSDVTKADLDPWMAFNDNVSLESINATMASQSTLVYPTSTEQFVKSTFLAVFGYTPAVTAATTAGFNYWINEIDTGSVSKTNLMIAFLNGASTGDRATIDANIASAVTAYESGQTTYLSATQDVVKGTDKNDTFIGDIIGNTDSLQSGDRIDGGAGTDTLTVDLGNYSSTVTSVRTTAVENFVVRAQSDNNDDAQNNTTSNTSIVVDAQRMDGVNRYESNESRADLIIEDVRIDVAGGQVTKDITVAMVSTDAGDPDFGVYFDQHSLINAPAIAAGAGLQLKVMDITNAANTGDFLLKNPFDKILFNFGGADYILVLDDNYIRGSYDLLLAEINTKIGQTVGLETVTAKIDGTFTGTDSRDGSTVAGGQTIVLTTTSDKIFAEGGWAASGVLPSDAEFLALQDLATGSSSSFLITSTIILDDVGSKSNGGDLVVGGMSTGLTSSSKGVEQFDITVEKSSILGTINSTNNSLQEVFIVNGTTKGDLTVNGNNAGGNELPGDDAQDNAYGFSDVKILNASTMTGKVNITAELTDAIVAKYLNSTDTALEATDNDTFTYTLGTSDDTLALALSNSNLTSGGTVAREDFVLSVNAGNGNDTVQTMIGDGTGNDTTAWYENQKQLSNLSVDAGSGDDTITTTGAGNMTINAGLGNDTVYADNSGTKGTWIMNATAGSTTAYIADATNNTTFSGLITAEQGTPTITVAASVAAAVTAAKVITAASAQTAAEITAMDAALDAAAATAGASQATIYSTLIAASKASLVPAADGTLITDADTITGTANALLYGATLTVTYAGAAANSVVGGVAAAGTIGYESSVKLTTNGNLGNEGTIVQAIKAAINGDAVLSKLLMAKDDTGDVLNITSKIDGLSAAGDLAFSIVAANANGTSDGLASAATNISGATTILTASQLTSMKAEWNDILNTSTAVIADGAMYTQLQTAATAALTAVVADVAVVVGNESTATSDNIVKMGAGNDVVVLGTNDVLLQSNDIIEFAGYNQGNDTIVNYLEGAGTNLDTIDLSAYLSDGALNKVSLTGSVNSQTQIAQVKSTAAVTAADTVVANEILIYTGLTFSAANQTAGQSFDNMTAANFKAAINNASTVAYGNINAAIDADNTVVANFVGTTQTSIVFVENDLNDGEYKIFELSQDNTANLEFSDVKLVGTVDFGDSITVASVII